MLKSNAHTNVFRRYDETEAGLNYNAVTPLDGKFNSAATQEKQKNRWAVGFPYSDRIKKWDQDKYTAPANKLGMSFGEDVSVVQRYAPGGMFGQLHAGKSTGTEMRTLPFKTKYSSYTTAGF